MKKLCDCSTTDSSHECCDALKTVKPDFEAMYNKMRVEHDALSREHTAMRAEFVRMKAQLEIVYLIFGKK